MVTTGRPHPGNWLGIPARPVLDATVAATIRTARARGRTPGESAPPCLLDMSQGLTRAD
ncbi:MULTISPECIES: hypothetical protein [Streptomyces]|uniref:hypothetical protein n=1 Tax=Streptomyces TaxID=1883 RepID=UPI000AFF497B|nr:MULTISPECIES: hypothetical protein [unclassified Streptomyces]